MDRDKLMKLSAEKAVQELTWDRIEFLFRPQTVLDLLLRHDFEGMKQKIWDWYADDEPGAMPHRFRDPYFRQMKRAIDIEEFYRACKEAHDGRCVATQ